ncbi:hypothetical protein ASG97_06395 [Bacillus sp. Soil745]|nr:hypothetical protein ASG97_06395 [Bacillus sp. Soil745]
MVAIVLDRGWLHYWYWIFIGSAISIKITGPSIVLSIILAAIGTYIVYSLLAKMTAENPQDGSFCYYANKAYGRWAGFS